MSPNSLSHFLLTRNCNILCFSVTPFSLFLHFCCSFTQIWFVPLAGNWICVTWILIWNFSMNACWILTTKACHPMSPFYPDDSPQPFYHTWDAIFNSYPMPCMAICRQSFECDFRLYLAPALPLLISMYKNTILLWSVALFPFQWKVSIHVKFWLCGMYNDTDIMCRYK